MVTRKDEERDGRDWGAAHSASLGRWQGESLLALLSSVSAGLPNGREAFPSLDGMDKMIAISPGSWTDFL